LANAKTLNYSDLSVAVGGVSRHDGAEIRKQLSILGMQNIQIDHEIESARHSVEKKEPDLFLCSMSKFGNEARTLFQSIRNQEVGHNPFVVMISMAGRMSESDVALNINSGTDDLLVGSFVRDRFVNRLNELAWNRRKFVALTNYVGPTRRNSARDGRAFAPEFEVPNPVRSIGTGIARKFLREEIAEAVKTLNIHKFGSDIALIRELVEEIVPDYKTGYINDDFKRRIGMLHDVVEDLRLGATRIDNGDLISLCELTGSIVAEIKARPIPPNLRHIQVMPKLVVGFETALASAREKTGSA
jgi:hypothetical protein